MIKYIIHIIFIFLYFTSFAIADECQDNIAEYNAEGEQNLQNGYYIKPITNNDLISLVLMRKNLQISELNSNSCGLPLKNLGFIDIDFLNTFIFIQRFGFGDPQVVKLIEKLNGKTIIHFEGFILDYNKKYELFVYRNTDNNSTNVYDISNHKNYKLKIDALLLNNCHLKNIDDDNECLNRSEICDGYIKILQITSKTITLKIGNKYKTIVRQSKKNRGVR